MQLARTSRLRIGRLHSGRWLFGNEGDVRTKNLLLSVLAETQHLDPVAQRELISRAQSGDHAALLRMVETNLKIIYACALDQAGRGVPVLDLFDEGVVSLMEGVQRFDLDRPVHPMTYLVWWIKKGMKQAIADLSDVVRVPRYRQRRDLNRAHVPVGPKGAFRTLGTSGNGELAPRADRYISIHHELENDGSMIGDLLRAPEPEYTQEDIDDAIYRCRHEYRLMLLKLAHQRTVGILYKQAFFDYYGFGDEPPKLFEEVASKYGVTKQRIEQRVTYVIRRVWRMTPIPTTRRWLNRLSEAYNAMREVINDRQQYGLEA